MKVGLRAAGPLAWALLLVAFGLVNSSAAASAARTAPSVRADAAESANGPSFAVGQIVVRFTDPSRRVTYPGHHSEPRSLVTIIRYPALGPRSRVDAVGVPPARASGLFPLIVFAHGFNTTPAPYARLLEAWARAGYVVAAPIFPLTNANAPGGPDEADLVNQPTDVSFVITRMLAAAEGSGLLARLINPLQIAVAGQSDGGSTALAAAYNRHYADHRIRAAMILSGAEIPGVGGYTFPPPSPPLLTVQGTHDVMNVPASTYQFFRIAPHPKFLLSLFGAGHLGPYTDEQPQLGIVERVTLAFLDRFLKHRPGARLRMWAAGTVAALARLSS